MFGLMHLLLSRSPDVEFTTSLSVDECKKRLMQELERKRIIFSFQPPLPVVERIKRDKFLISRNQSFLCRDNGLVLDGQLKATNSGVLVRASFRLYGSTSIILILGFGLFFGMAANEVISNGADIKLLLIPIFFWGLWGLVLWLMFWVNKSRRNGLAVYLQNILNPSTNSGR